MARTLGGTTTDSSSRRRTSGSRTSKSRSSGRTIPGGSDSPGRERTETSEYRATTASPEYVPRMAERAVEAGYGDAILGGGAVGPGGAGGPGGSGGGGYGGGYGGGGGGPSQYDIQKEAAEKAIRELQELYTGGSYRAAEDLLLNAIGDAQQRDMQMVGQSYDQLLQSITGRETSEAFNRMASGQTGATRGNDPLSQKFRSVGQDLHRSEQQYKQGRIGNANEARAFAREEVRAAAAAGRMAANMKAAERANALADQIIQLAVQYGLDIPDISGMMSQPTRQALGGM